MKLLVLGGWGQLGTDLARVAEGRHELVRPAHGDVDVRDADAVAAAATEVRPDALLDLAAFHKVELCEEDPSTSFVVNAVGAWNAAKAARAVGARCVFVSSDYVFDGERAGGYAEDDRVGPLNVYGVSKVAGERAVMLACPDSLVVRGSGLFGHAGSSGKGGNFVETMLSKAAAGDAISVVDDQMFAPTSTRDMAERMVLLLERDVPPGIYHAANAGSCSWYRFARTAFELAGVEADLTPRPAGEQAVRRPRSSILLDTKSATLGLPPNRPWREALRWYLETRVAAREAAEVKA
ncbi:MAG TPA: dTDP-4-dehydrorhamnose reductase [Actinomycetota bacterium]|nr:dTDP-4-dehydrorhamnose reductase [Actinomycetota bacterium]